MISVHHFLILGLILFLIGIYGVITRRNAIGILMGIELMFNGANINLAIIGSRLDSTLGGHVFVIFVITVAAAEAAVGLALILSVYRHIKSVYVEKINLLKE